MISSNSFLNFGLFKHPKNFLLIQLSSIKVTPLYLLISSLDKKNRLISLNNYLDIHQ